MGAYYSCEETAFGELHSRYSRHLRAFFRTLRFDDDTCADLVHETLLKIVLGKEGRGPKFNQGSFRAWLFRIAHNLAVDEWRRRRRWVSGEGDDLETQTRPLERPPDVWARPVEIFETIALEQELKKCLAELSDRDCLILILKYCEGFSVKEIEGMLSLGYNQVNMALHHARKRVRKCLEGKRF